ncbi:MAG: valine--tRNA ligase [Candidatus Paceibacterota bacterium]|jgi:valyl-tRNA synthetase
MSTQAPFENPLGNGAYEPKTTEETIYKEWEDSGFFNPDLLPFEKDAEPYVVYMPLPNVTGSLHMGHALDNTFQDITVRYHRMQGRRALWLPGTDHAGIATQYVVEKDLRKQGISRFELGREKFVEKIWEWKKQYGGLILSQLKKLGCSADWSRTRFTMDPEYAKDVKNAFIHYYEKGLIYRGYRTVNWCPRCGTSLSELELEYKDEETNLWHIRYAEGVVVATTRPETMLGDTAIAVNPNDERYTKRIGTKVTLPLMNREIPIIGDEAIDKEFGTGMVKVTPAHDVLDFEIGERHKLPMVIVIDERGKMTKEAGVYAGMKAIEARAKIVEDLGDKIIKVEPYAHRVSICYRCGSTIEPIPSMQWFLKMKGLAANAIEAVKSGKVHITPDRFEKTYFDWLENIRDWTLSRQIWWGHQLPVWFHEAKCTPKKGKESEMDKCKEMIVSITEPTCEHCDSKFIQAEDVMDTWFSSALWPFAGLSEKDRKNYYPGHTLITARDILNLWVARMIYSGIEFMGEAPFKNVLIHGTIMTKDGKRMSKSLGTGIDPLKYIDEYGADVTRFAVVWQATGQDIRWDETAVVGGKKFLNKLWNAAKFVLGQQDEIILFPVASKLLDSAHQTDADKKILEELSAIKESVKNDIQSFEFAKALREVYDFFWHSFCDVYLEIAKKQIVDPISATRTRAILLHVLGESLCVLHPFLPFITEVVWKKIPRKEKTLLLITRWS